MTLDRRARCIDILVLRLKRSKINSLVGGPAYKMYPLGLVVIQFFSNLKGCQGLKKERESFFFGWNVLYLSVLVSPWILSIHG